MVGVKICAICHITIHAKDDYCRLTDYRKGKFFVEYFYHTLCFNQQIKGMNPQQKMAMSMLDKANKLLNRVQGEPEKIYDIK